jgi:hypothetical protein
MQAPRQLQVADFIDAGGFIPCPVSAFAEFRQANPAVREETLGGRVSPADKEQTTDGGTDAAWRAAAGPFTIPERCDGGLQTGNDAC